MASTSRRPRSTLLTTLGVLAALALVAVAARGSTSAGGSGVRKPSEMLLDFLVSLYIVLLVLGLVMVIVLLVLRRHVRPPDRDPKRNALRSLAIASVFVVGAFLVLQRLELRNPDVRLPPPQPPATSDDGQTQGAGGDTYEAEFAWLPMLALGLLALLGLGLRPYRVLADLGAAAAAAALVLRLDHLVHVLELEADLVLVGAGGLPVDLLRAGAGVPLADREEDEEDHDDGAEHEHPELVHWRECTLTCPWLRR